MTNVTGDILRDLKDLFLRIEIDSDDWVGKSTADKLIYLREFLSKENKASLINAGFRTADSIISIIRANTRSRTVKSYVDLADTAVGLAKISMVLNNIFVAKTTETHTDDDDLAAFMGRKSGTEIFSQMIDSTSEMCRCFIQMTKAQQAKYGVKIEKISYMNEGSTSLSDTNTADASSGHTINAYVMLTIGGHKVACEMLYSNKPKKPNEDEGSSSDYSSVKLGCYLSDIIGTAEIESILYSLYIDSIDVVKHFIKIDAGRMHPAKRIVVDYDINNFNLADMVTTIKAVKKNNKRRGYMIQGDPGTGKTVSIHKLMMEFPDTPVFWISADSINTPEKIRKVFRILNMFPGSIFVFDDIDGNDFSAKSQMTTVLLSCIDATTADKFNGIIIMTVNEPQRIHNTIKTRPERIDEVILVKNPDSVDAVIDVITQRFKHLKAELPVWVSPDNELFVTIADKIVQHQFTHTHIASLVSDLVDLFIDDEDNYTCEMFDKMVDRRILSISNSRMTANENGHIEH